MSLSDRETLELNELCDAAVEGTLTGVQRARLEEWIAKSDDVRRYYVKAMDLSASLGHYASEMQMEAADTPSRITHLLKSSSVKWVALAASLAIAVTWWLTGNSTRETKASPAKLSEYVARLTGAKECVWANVAGELKPGDFLRSGQRLRLEAGFAEVTFDSGAVILLEGPVVFDVKSAWDSTLRRGAIKAHVPPQALGFRVSNSAVEVIDMGTEFSMVADGHGGADVVVLKGEVEAMPRGREDPETILLHANQSRRFGSAGVTNAEDPAQLLARFNTPVSLNRSSGPIDIVHWSFDELKGKTSAANVIGFSAADFQLNLLAPSPAARAKANVEGIRGRALQFDGQVAARAEFAGLSGNFPRTIAFWVKVPENAPLSGAYSMIAWRADSELLGARPVHIAWNRHPMEGPLGAIRTDFSGGHAMGTTSLRDGRWHHVSVIFLITDDPDMPVQVKQYVDGRLESNTVTPGPKRSIGASTSLAKGSTNRDRIWLGCRLGANGPKKERFLGEIDELVVVNRGLGPAELIELMDGRVAAAVQQIE